LQVLGPDTASDTASVTFSCWWLRAGRPP